MSKKNKPAPKAFKYFYFIKNCANPLLEGMSLDFREDDRESANKRAKEESLIFGPYAKAVFVKVV